MAFLLGPSLKNRWPGGRRRVRGQAGAGPAGVAPAKSQSPLFQGEEAPTGHSWQPQPGRCGFKEISGGPPQAAAGRGLRSPVTPAASAGARTEREG